MSRQRPSDAEAEAQVGRTLRQASSGYGDLPDHVGDRLDRVLDTLPPADVLHAGPRESWAERWAERLRPKRVRYALVSAAAAVLVTVGGVATAVQYVAAPGNEDSGASADMEAEGGTERADDEAPGAAENEEAPMSGETEAEDGADGIVGVETFASGSDYDEGTDLLTTLRELGSDSALTEGATSAIPAELTELAAGGEFWKNCEEAIAKEYASLLVAVDFARYESQPAIVALMAGDGGDIAVALTPACADGVIEPLAVQP